MKKTILVLLNIFIIINFLQADTLANKVYSAVKKMKAGLNCIDSCWAEPSFTSPIQILDCVTKCPRESECKNDNALENKIVCSTEKSLDAIFKCQTNNSKNVKAAKACSAKEVTKYLTKNVEDFEKSFSKISDDITDIMDHSSFAVAASSSNEVASASTRIQNTKPIQTKAKQYTTLPEEMSKRESAASGKVAGMNSEYTRRANAAAEYNRQQAQQAKKQRPANNNSSNGSQASQSYDPASSPACANAKGALQGCEFGENNGGFSCDSLRQSVSNYCGGGGGSTPSASGGEDCVAKAKAAILPTLQSLDGSSNEPEAEKEARRLCGQ